MTMISDEGKTLRKLSKKTKPKLQKQEEKSSKSINEDI